MVKRGPGCDYCSERSAVVYCRADSARLCIQCDNHVHSANSLSGKHERSQICDNCSSAASSVRCSTDNLLLCSDCDFDAHPITSTHLRSTAPLPYSGTPSPIDLANAWGINVFHKFFDNDVDDDYDGSNKGNNDKREFNCWNELMVPNDVGKNNNSMSCCEKQLLELLGDGVGTGHCGPGTPNNGGEFNQQEEQEVDEGVGVVVGSGGGEFTSLLMMQMQTTADNDNNNGGGVMKEEGDGGFLWNNNNNNANSTRGGDHSSQIWDFKLGQLRDHDESGSLELDFGGSEMEYFTKGYGELLKEASGTRRGGLDFPVVSCSFAKEEMIPFNGAPNNQTASQGPATSESNNIAAPCSGFSTRPKSYGCSKEIQFTGESISIKTESGTAAITNADLELLAKNRGNAMQRYMEKKKNRRYDKQIRYESRKARADTRKRVKGRFVKASDTREG